MNFGIWLLKRVKRKVFGHEQYGWIAKYREFIMEEKPISIILTILFGLLWFIACGVVTLWLVDDKELGGNIMKGVILSIPLFYVYNWIAALYEIYDTERMACWEELKR